MGTFEGHLLPGVAFVIYGAWHLVSAIRRWRRAPADFHAHAFWPSGLSGWLRYLELWLIIIGTCISLSMELFFSHPNFTPLDEEGNLPAGNLLNFEHSCVSFFFLLFAISSVVTDCNGLPWQIPFVFGASALGVEYMVFYFHSADHMGLEGHYHVLLRVPIVVGLLSAVGEMLNPTQFVLSVTRALSFILQGLWLSQTAFSIWVPSFWPLHCVRNDLHLVVCDTEEWDHRGKAIANLLFVLWTAVTLLTMLVSFACLMRGHEHKQKGYEVVSVEVEGKEGRVVVSEEKPLKEEEHC